MGWKAMIAIIALWAFSLLVLNPSLSIMPSWLVDNAELWILTQVLWHVSFALGFYKFGVGGA